MRVLVAEAVRKERPRGAASEARLFQPDAKDDELAARDRGVRRRVRSSVRQVTRAMLQAGRLASSSGRPDTAIDVDAPRARIVANCQARTRSRSRSSLRLILARPPHRRGARTSARVWNKRGEAGRAYGSLSASRDRRDRPGDDPAPRLSGCRSSPRAGPAPERAREWGDRAKGRRRRRGPRSRRRVGPPRLEARDARALRRRVLRRVEERRFLREHVARRSRGRGGPRARDSREGDRGGARRLRRGAGRRVGRGEGTDFRLPGVIGTHHIGASTDQAQEAIAAGPCIAREFRDTGRPPNAVNLARSPGDAPLVAPL